ncbi:MAG: type I 3-dehydroquinate dehydratase, partial [Planctomycetes bacterium]|nr:type I 3-dehydroquinate dehydratase [Planctomycetota bacterium]
TCRRAQDGGGYEGDEASRLSLLRDFAQAGVRYVDIESDVTNADEVADPPSALRSFHNMEGTDASELGGVLAELKAQSAFNVKLCTKANALMDNLVHREMLQEMQSLWLRTSFCMGSSGMPSRLMQVLWGGDLVYGAADDAQEELSTLPSLRSLVKDFRLRHFAKGSNPAQVYGLVGSSISASRSPEIHNNFFAREGIDAIYIPMQGASADECAEFAKAIGTKGLSVTTPFKESIAKAFGEASADAVNTVEVRDNEARFANTDIEGFQVDLARLIDDRELARARVLLLGSGGAAWAVLQALDGRAGEVLVHARRADAAKAIAAKAGVGFHPAPHEDEFGFDLVVNATPCGMAGSNLAEESPLELASLTFNENACVYDLVSRRELTSFLREAKRLGL